MRLQCIVIFAPASNLSQDGNLKLQDLATTTPPKPALLQDSSYAYSTDIMGWWPFSSSDPVTNLDPKLREFLEKESPKYESQPEPKATNTPTQNAASSVAAKSKRSDVPAESLYQDGRYAHLWKNYRPQGDIEAETASDHDKLMGVYESFQERKQEIQRAALENCSGQQEEWTNCMKHGKIEDQLQMCRHQVRRFEKCYSTQSVCPHLSLCRQYQSLTKGSVFCGL